MLENVTKEKTTTVADFLEFIHRPENLEQNYEFINGEIVPVVSSPKSSKLAFRIGTFLGVYLMQNDIGHGMTSDGGYVIGEGRYIPDVSFISYEKQPGELQNDQGYVPAVPDFVVEIISPTDRQRDVMAKIGHYLEAGVLVWVIYPEAKQVVVYTSGNPPRVFTVEDTLDGGEVLPGFNLAVKELFA